MSSSARSCCAQAQDYIRAGHYAMAIGYLRLALKGTSNRKAWSKLMLAIRELGRIVPANS